MGEYKMVLPQAVAQIIRRLEGQGYEAYAVGGCVRDAMLGREPEDWDITTSATPSEVKKVFHKTIDTGIQHGTVTVMLDGTGYEVTTYRIDGEYEDGRHPKEVSFTGNLELDLARRDFTINAMAYNEDCGLVDIFDGIGDLQKKVIRCVGDAGQRFDEDALRMLRAVRFSGQLGFEIATGTSDAIRERASHLEKISGERIRVEMTKLLMSMGAERLRDAYELGMTKVFLPEFDRMMTCDQKNRHHAYTVGEHCIQSVQWMNRLLHLRQDQDIEKGWERSTLIENAPKEEIEAMLLKTGISGRAIEKMHQIVLQLTKKQLMILSVTMLLHDVAKPDTMTIDEMGVGHFYGHPEKSAKMAEKILKRLTFDNEMVDTACRLIYYHDHRPQIKRSSIRRLASKVGKEYMWMEFLVRYADILSQNPETYPEKFPSLEQEMWLYEEIEAAKQPLTVKDLAISGKELIQAGMKPGPEMGAVLKGLLDAVLEDPDLNTKENLLRLVEEMNLC